MDTVSVNNVTMDTFSLISNVLSIILSIVSLTLSLYFFNLSQKTNRDSERIAGEIKNSVNKLEDLFNKLYSDTFSMLKSQNSLMQNHFMKTAGNINLSNGTNKSTEPKYLVIAKIFEHKNITIDTLQKQFSEIDENDLLSIVNELKQSGSIQFDGVVICFKGHDSNHKGQGNSSSSQA